LSIEVGRLIKKKKWKLPQEGRGPKWVASVLAFEFRASYWLYYSFLSINFVEI
jgi:hypothetical protein